MAKALVIKGANFSTNKVGTVTFGESVPCTGLTLSQSTMTATVLGVAGTLTATKTPENTTDQLTWASSDTDVATVADGVVTIVGVGTATVTATCGTITASCTVTATSTVDLDTAYHAENGARYSGSMNLNANPVKNHIGRTNDTRGRLFYSTEAYGNYRAFSNATFTGEYCIPIPKGANHVKIIFPTGMEKRHIAFILANADEQQTYVTGVDGQSALGVYPFVFNNITDAEKEFDLGAYAENANGFIMSWAFISTSQTDASTITGHTTVVFSHVTS